MKKEVLATGLSGLVGSRVKELLGDIYEFIDLSFATGVDITDYEQVLLQMGKTDATTVLHLAAKTDVDGCELDKMLGEDGQAWQVNVIGTENIIHAAKKFGKRVIYISTDYIFDGTKDFYTEEDEPNPINWYAQTKYEGERLISAAGEEHAILRIAYPYRAYYNPKKDFVRRILEKLEKKETIRGLTDHLFTPTFIDDIVQAFNLFISKKISGTYHIVGSSSHQAYKGVQLIAKVFGYNAHIEQITRDVFFKDRAFRPFKLALKNDKITQLGIKMHTFEEGLYKMKQQLQ